MRSLSILVGLAVVSLSALKLSQAAQCFANFGVDKYPTCAQLSPNVSLHWAVRDGTITWAVDVDGVWDWVGIGISEGGMFGADLAVAAHDAKAGQWNATDYWSTNFDTPEQDQQQDVILISIARQSHGGSDQGSTLVVLRRPLVSCDAAGQDQPVLNDTRQIVVHAYGKGSFGYHGPMNRGESEVVFVPNITSDAAAASGSGAAAIPGMQTFEMRMPAVNGSTPLTTFMCVNLALPNTSGKFHIYRYEPLSDDLPILQRVVAYSCGARPQPPPTLVGVLYPCGGRSMECGEFYMGWAPGVDRVDAPPGAALAFGLDTGVTYMTLQVQYSDVEDIAKQTDPAGLRIYYSTTLKQYDMGVLTLGSYDVAVPPDANSWTTPANICPGACTAALTAKPVNSSNNSLPGGGLVLVDSFYHMRDMGRSAVTRHVRGGVELPPLGVREHFGVDYQAPVGVPPGSRQLLAGDLLITTCSYGEPDDDDDDDDEQATKQGEEVCFNFLTYYPYNRTITECIALRPLNMSTCTTSSVLDRTLPDRSAGNATAEAVKSLVDAGGLVPLPANLKYTPYQPKCVRTAPPATSGSSFLPDPEAAGARHRRNVGGAVAAILIVTLVGAVAIFLVYRAMRRRRQLEEEQNLFEKYNPNSIVLPIPAVGSSALFPPSPVAGAAAAPLGGAALPVSGGSPAGPGVPHSTSNGALTTALAAARGYSAIPTTSAV